MLIYGRCGLGDNIYWRPLVRAILARAPKVYIETPWPELYGDLPGVVPVKPRKTKLRTQLVNIARHERAGTFKRMPVGVRKLRLKYAWEDVARSNVFAVMEARAGFRCEPFTFDLPDFGPAASQWGKPVAVLRPATERREWLNPARNPRPEYIARAAEILQAQGFRVYLVADMKDGMEWYAGGLEPQADMRATSGELHVKQLLALVQHAAVVVGPVGWIVPACIATRTPLVVIGGGQGAHNHPDRLIDPRMDASRVKFILPEPYCVCADMLHTCPKDIPEFDRQFTEALESLCLQTT